MQTTAAWIAELCCKAKKYSKAYEGELYEFFEELLDSPANKELYMSSRSLYTQGHTRICVERELTLQSNNVFDQLSNVGAHA